MKVIICGGGQVGWQLARHLSREKNDVTVVDNNANLIRRITEALDVSGIAGFASHPDILSSAGARDADMIIAATQSDEVNMVTCQIAHSIFAVPRKVARLRSKAYLDAIYSDLYRRDHLPIDIVISPENEVANVALQRLASPAAFDTENFMKGRGQLIGLAVEENCPIVNTTLRQLSELFSTLKSVIVGIRRDGHLFTPEPDDQQYVGDEVYIFAAAEDVPRVLDIYGKESRKSRRVILIGGGNVGLTVAQSLERSPEKVRTKLIERDRSKAEAVADLLERTVVLHGDGMDLELLEEANLAEADAVLALTDDDKTNLLACTRAKAEGCPLVIALVNDPTLGSMFKPLGIDAVINPRGTTVSSILRHIRHGRIQAVYSVGDGEAEMIEAQVLGTSLIAGKTLRDVDWPAGAIVGGILKGETFVLPRGNTRIEEGDILSVFALAGDVAAVEQLFQVSIDYF